jgi:ABC-type dipeptide/oligopeptide/nickel transport system permease component
VAAGETGARGRASASARPPALMQAYLLRRIAQSVLTLVGMSVLVFVILRVLPGDPAKMLLPEGAPQSAVDELNRQLGLKEPLHVQYGIFLRSVFHGDFGQSFQYRAPALLVVRERLPATIQLTLCAMALTVLAGVTIGIVAAVRPGTRYDYVGTILAVLGQSLPSFWLGIMLVLLFGVTLRWFPTSGFQNWTYLILPSLTLAAYPTALVARLTRSSMLEILNRDYIRTGRAKGLAERAVILRHALRNATIPVLTVLGLQIGTLLGGAVITESVFAWPGMGKLVVDAIYFRDFPVVQTVLILSATIFVVINLIVDALYTVVDPRIRYR